MPVRSLHVAEKPSVAKSIAAALGGGPNQYQTFNGHSQYNRIYAMNAEIGAQGRPSQMR